MARHALLIAGLAIAAFAGLVPEVPSETPPVSPTPSPPQQPSKACDESSGALRFCTTLDDGRLRLGATETKPGNVPRGRARVYLPGTTPPPTMDMTCVVGAEGNLRPACFRGDEEEDPEPAIPGVTITDFVSFAPAPATPHSEPGAFALRNLPTNFYAEASAHVRTGVLLGQSASAQFMPVAYTWEFGDGTSILTDTAGGTWEALGEAEFAETPSSRTYTEKGTYTVTLTTHYGVRAAYASDGVWWDVPGTLPIASAPFTLQVHTVKTVLVDKDCNEDPSGPGC